MMRPVPPIRQHPQRRRTAQKSRRIQLARTLGALAPAAVATRRPLTPSTIVCRVSAAARSLNPSSGNATGAVAANHLATATTPMSWASASGVLLPLGRLDSLVEDIILVPAGHRPRAIRQKTPRRSCQMEQTLGNKMMQLHDHSNQTLKNR